MLGMIEWLEEALSMAIHDWTHAPPGYFHHFHQRWAGAICDALNDGILPPDLFALVEQRTIGVAPDVLAISERAGGTHTRPSAPLSARPTARFVTQAEPQAYAARANRVAVRSAEGEIVAVIEIV